ncbi:chaperone NapD [Ideonella sp. DXS22W]|uniref:Chaperone NapD n=1 Tax=Pseudaquabacterium inlustre TaxID=2984192 RepID=A0ABU9CG24_9BURK
MSILGVIVRTRPEDLAATEQALRALPGTDIAAPAGEADGRLVVVIEDTPARTAAAVMAEIALWPRVLNTSLVYEYSGPDVPHTAVELTGYTDWRNSLADGRGPLPRRG